MVESKIRLPHVHRNALDSCELFARKPGPEGIDRRTLAAMSNKKHDARIEIGDQSKVAMTLLDGLLVDAEVSDEPRLLPSPASLDSTHHDRIDLIPTHRHATRNRRHRHLANERDRDALEALREFQAARQPGDSDRDDAVLGAVDARHERVQEQLIPAEIEVAPCSFAVIVLRALTPARWAPAGAFPFQSDVDAASLEIEHRFGNIPGTLDPKKAAE